MNTQLEITPKVQQKMLDFNFKALKNIDPKAVRLCTVIGSVSLAKWNQAAQEWESAKISGPLYVYEREQLVHKIVLRIMNTLNRNSFTCVYSFTSGGSKCRQTTETTVSIKNDANNIFLLTFVSPDDASTLTSTLTAQCTSPPSPILQ